MNDTELSPPDTQVLVTGGSGFIAGHVIAQLLDAGYRVRTTVRNLDRSKQVVDNLKAYGVEDVARLSFAAADLTKDAGWDEAMDGVDAVMHVASPVLPGKVDNEDDAIVPAREGTRRVLEAASRAGIERVVLTSAFHAVSWGHVHDEHVFTDEDWSLLDGPGVDAYAKAKTLAELDAWQFAAAHPEMELVTLLPVAVMGPVMGPAISGSNHVLQMMLSGKMPAMPHVFMPVVDVRDVADAHLRAMTTPHAAGNRYLLSAGPAMELKEIAETLRTHLGSDAGKVPTRTVPNAVVKLAALFVPQMREVAPDLGYSKQTSNAKAARELGWHARDPHEAVVAAARSMVERGFVS